MRTRNHDWFDTKNGKTLYSFQVFHAGKWRHVAEDGKPLLYRKPQERDAKRKEYRATKAGERSLLPLRDAYDRLNEQLADTQARLAAVLRLDGASAQDALAAATGRAETPESLRARANDLERVQRDQRRRRLTAELRALVNNGATDEELAAWFSTGEPYLVFGSNGDNMRWTPRQTANHFLTDGNYHG